MCGASPLEARKRDNVASPFPVVPVVTPIRERKRFVEITRLDEPGGQPLHPRLLQHGIGVRHDIWDRVPIDVDDDITTRFDRVLVRLGHFELSEAEILLPEGGQGSEGHDGQENQVLHDFWFRCLEARSSPPKENPQKVSSETSCVALVFFHRATGGVWARLALGIEHIDVLHVRFGPTSEGDRTDDPRVALPTKPLLVELHGPAVRNTKGYSHKSSCLGLINDTLVGNLRWVDAEVGLQVHFDDLIEHIIVHDPVDDLLSDYRQGKDGHDGQENELLH